MGTPESIYSIIMLVWFIHVINLVQNIILDREKVKQWNREKEKNVKFQVKLELLNTPTHVIVNRHNYVYICRFTYKKEITLQDQLDRLNLYFLLSLYLHIFLVYLTARLYSADLKSTCNFILLQFIKILLNVNKHE